MYIPYAAPMSKQTAPGRTNSASPSSSGSLSDTVAAALSSAAAAPNLFMPATVDGVRAAADPPQERSRGLRRTPAE
ncbi:hypothetical protein GCM10020216_096110 [Nonomuraea helvata]